MPTKRKTTTKRKATAAPKAAPPEVQLAVVAELAAAHAEKILAADPIPNDASPDLVERPAVPTDRPTFVSFHGAPHKPGPYRARVVSVREDGRLDLEIAMGDTGAVEARNVPHTESKEPGGWSVAE